MDNREESFSMLRDYMGFDRRTLFVFLALVAGVFIVVTGIYIAIFGFQEWETNMQRAGSMMIANYDAPVAPRLAPAAAVPAVQFSCPNCGAVGLPRWNPGGTPVCPNCGSVMTVGGRAGANSRIAVQP
jgi:predicted RNA-binding Zn-ribbon protein involved in translation (DUF1610 family)